MSNWKDEYNYRRIKDKNGKVIKNVIFIDGEQIEVNDEVYQVYSQMHRREMYQEQQIEEFHPISLDYLMDCNVPIDLYIAEHSASAEDIIVQIENENKQDELIQKMMTAIEKLTADEKVLIKALYYEGVSTRAYAKMCGVYQRAIIYRRDKILKKLKEILCLND